MRASPASSFRSETRPPPPPPAPGTPWDRMTRAERTAAVRSAVAAGRTAASLATDHMVTSGSYDWRLVAVMHRSWTEKMAGPADLAAPGRTDSPGVLIRELSAAVCRFPLWSAGETVAPGPDEAHYCGAPRDSSYTGPYCPHHRHVARRY